DPPSPVAQALYAATVVPGKRLDLRVLRNTAKAQIQWVIFRPVAVAVVHQRRARVHGVVKGVRDPIRP
ncbi:hypothetical protein RA282_30805, partial [Pseudomonas syringae pv. tagetis]